MGSKGFMESLFDSALLWAAVQDSKDADGKPDPYKAAGIAYGMRGDLPLSELMELGGYLGDQGAFKPSPIDYSNVEQKTALEEHRLKCNEELRIASEELIEAYHRYWEIVWRNHLMFNKACSPTELAEKIWLRESAGNDKSPYKDPDFRESFAQWLETEHGIMMDENNQMHLIAQPNDHL